MALSDIAGVFSRHFVIGFFAPTFFALFLVSRIIDPSALPPAYNDASGGTQVLVVGGASLLLALLLSGLHYNVLRLFEGYPLDRLNAFATRTEPEPVLIEGYYAEPRARQIYLKWRLYRLRRLGAGIARVVYRLAMWRVRRSFDRLRFRRAGVDDDDRTRAAYALAKLYPDDRGQLLPTRFGNAMRSFERHPRSRYGLDGITMWPRVELILSEKERGVVNNASTDLAFFVNATVLLLAMGITFAVDGAIHGWPATPLWLLYGLPFLAAWLAYRFSVGAAVRWGDFVRASFDLHRLDYYKQLGVRAPRGPVEERAIARKVTRMLLFGEPLDAEVRIQDDDRYGR